MSRRVTSGDSMAAPLVSTVTDNFTLASWMKVFSFPGGNVGLYFNGVSGSNGWGCYIDGTQVHGLIGGVAVVGGFTPSVGDWHRYLVSRRSGTFSFYVDGVLNASSGSGVNVPGTSTVIPTGLDIAVAELMIVEHALTDLEIVADAKGCPPNRLMTDGRAPKQYVPLWGLASPEPDLILGDAFPMTLSGTPAVYAPAPMQPYAGVAEGFFLPSAVPANTGTPIVTGSAIVNGSLFCSTGTWINSPTGYTYQWQQSDDGVGGWADLGGETASTLTVPIGADGKYLRCVVTATNSAGSASANSNVVGPIQSFTTVKYISVIG